MAKKIRIKPTAKRKTLADIKREKDKAERLKQLPGEELNDKQSTVEGVTQDTQTDDKVKDSIENSDVTDTISEEPVQEELEVEEQISQEPVQEELEVEEQITKESDSEEFEQGDVTQFDYTSNKPTEKLEQSDVTDVGDDKNEEQPTSLFDVLSDTDDTGITGESIGSFNHGGYYDLTPFDDSQTKGNLFDMETGVDRDTMSSEDLNISESVKTIQSHLDKRVNKINGDDLYDEDSDESIKQRTESLSTSDKSTINDTLELDGNIATELDGYTDETGGYDVLHDDLEDFNVEQEDDQLNDTTLTDTTDSDELLVKQNLEESVEEELEESLDDSMDDEFPDDYLAAEQELKESVDDEYLDDLSGEPEFEEILDDASNGEYHDDSLTDEPELTDDFSVEDDDTEEPELPDNDTDELTDDLTYAQELEGIIEDVYAGDELPDTYLADAQELTEDNIEQVASGEVSTEVSKELSKQDNTSGDEGSQDEPLADEPELVDLYQDEPVDDEPELDTPLTDESVSNVPEFGTTIQDEPLANEPESVDSLQEESLPDETELGDTLMDESSLLPKESVMIPPAMPSDGPEVREGGLLDPVFRDNLEMYSALVAYSEGGELYGIAADLRGITHVDTSIFEDILGVSQVNLVGTDNKETIEIPYEGTYIGVQHVKGTDLKSDKHAIKVMYYVSYRGYFYSATNDLKKGKRVNLAGEYITPVEPEEGVEAVIVQYEHADGVIFEYKVKDFTQLILALGLTPIQIEEDIKANPLKFLKSKIKPGSNQVKSKPKRTKQPKGAKVDEEGSKVKSKQTKQTKQGVAAQKPKRGAKGSSPQAQKGKGGTAKAGVKGKRPPTGKGTPQRKRKPGSKKPYSRYSDDKPTLWNQISSKTRALIMGIGFTIVLLVVGGQLLKPSNTIDYAAFNNSTNLSQVAEASFGKGYINNLDKQATIYFEPQHKKIKVAFLEQLEYYLSGGDNKEALDTYTLQYFTNLEYVYEKAFSKYRTNKQSGDTSNLVIIFEQNHEKLMQVTGGSIKDFTAKVMNGYSDQETLKQLLGVETTQEVVTFLSTFTDNIFYVYYNYVISQVDDLLEGVTDVREETLEGEEVLRDEVDVLEIDPSLVQSYEVSDTAEDE